MTTLEPFGIFRLKKRRALKAEQIIAAHVNDPSVKTSGTNQFSFHRCGHYRQKDFAVLTLQVRHRKQEQARKALRRFFTP